jgi:arsenite methyltransferase
MLKFDAETARLLDEAYLGSDFRMRRRANLTAIDPRPGEHVVDIGCGNGLMLPELARTVGPGGQVTGIDPSEDMLASARRLCHDRPNVAIAAGNAATLPLEDRVADKAVSVQVFEYLENVDGALAEIARILRPGGLLAIGDMHFGTLVWHSREPERMAAMLAAWDGHVVHTAIPPLLPPAMERNGFAVERITGFTITDHVLRPDGLAAIMLVLVAAYAVENGHADEATARAWADEQQRLAHEGEFFFSMTHFVVAARKR